MMKKSSKIGEKIKKMDARDYALYLISLNMQTEAKLKEKLERKGYDKTEISTVLARLTELGYLNDEQFAQMYFDNLKKYKNFGYYGIKRKLMDKKVPQKLADKLLKSLSVSEEQVVARRLLDKTPASKTVEQKMRMLVSRGFRTDVVMKELKRKLGPKE